MITAKEYLSHRYLLASRWPLLPLPDEPFSLLWEKMCGDEALNFLSERFLLPVKEFVWEKTAKLSITLVESLAGRLPCISTYAYQDFKNMIDLLLGKTKSQKLPAGVHALTMRPKKVTLKENRILLLHHAPYSDIPAAFLGLSDAAWLKISNKLRIRHECTHYETLRLFGGMKNHALDEILADLLGQIAAFGNFDADRQRLFFGLKKGQNTCSGRLAFYCRNVEEKERALIYEAVDQALDQIALEVCGLGQNIKDIKKIFTRIGTVSLWQRQANEKRQSP